MVGARGSRSVYAALTWTSADDKGISHADIFAEQLGQDRIGDVCVDALRALKPWCCFGYTYVRASVAQR